MKFLPYFRSLLMLVSGLYFSLALAADDVAVVKQTIPFKADQGAMAGSGVSIFVFMFLFISIALILLYLKKHRILKIGDDYKEGAIKVLGAKRLNTKTTAFVVDANGTEVLIVQAGDKTSLLQLQKNKE